MPKKNAAKRTVTITAEDITAGQATRQDPDVARPDTCPAALAVKREFGDPAATVGYSTLRANGELWVAVPADDLAAWICNADDGKNVEPFTFTVVRGDDWEKAQRALA